MIVHVSNTQKDLSLNKGSVRAFVQSLLKYLKVSAEEIGIYFVTEKKIRSLHEQFFNDPSTTDCISFPLDKTHLGEVFVCPSVALQYAKEKGLDPYSETTLYVVHGILHLLGYDDLEPKKRRTMRKKEKSCMGYLYKQKQILSS